MKSFSLLPLYTALLAVLTPATASPINEQAPLAPSDAERFLIEVKPGETLWVTEDEKWSLRRAGINFMDITEHQTFGSDVATAAITVKYPEKPSHSKAIKPMIGELSKKNMRTSLEGLTSFHTRYYKSKYGAESSAWLLNHVNETVAASGALDHGATVKHFHHPWGQHSIIVSIPGQTNNTIVIGAHQDSINLFLPSLLAAPGADDDGSGTVTILESLRVLLTSAEVREGRAPNTVEFHWYSAEEGGLLGSQAVFQQYQKEGRQVKAMLQQDMTGYVQGTLDAGLPESVGVITDFVDPALTEFIKEVVTEYCDIPFVLTKCGYACSDHASASKAGYPSAFVIESDFKNSNKKIHTTEDKIEYLSFDHMLQHARLTLGLAYELAFAKF